jgi:hypothetical protein
MKRLGKTFLGRGEGWFATKEDFKIYLERDTVKEFFVNRNYGSSFDNWIRIGAKSLNQDDLELLKATSRRAYISIRKKFLGDM